MDESDERFAKSHQISVLWLGVCEVFLCSDSKNEQAKVPFKISNIKATGFLNFSHLPFQSSG